MLQLYHPLQECQLSVCIQRFWSSRPLAPSLCRPDSLLPRSPCSVLCCVWTGILYSSRVLPWLGSSTHQHCLPDGHLWPELCRNFGVFIIQRPCSLCCFSKGEQRCVFGGERCRGWHCHWQGELQNPTVDFPPIICSSPGRHRQDHTGAELCVCVCVFVGAHLSVCVCHRLALVQGCQRVAHVYCMYTVCVYCAWGGTLLESS